MLCCSPHASAANASVAQQLVARRGDHGMVTNWVQRRGSSERDIERRTRQIKEIVRLGRELEGGLTTNAASGIGRE